MATAAAATPLLRNLPDEIVLWEIFVRLDAKSLLRSRAVRRDWRSATSTRPFLLAHHARQPALSISSHLMDDLKQDIVVLDHQAAQLHTVIRLDHAYHVEASCDGLLLLERHTMEAGSRTRLFICNAATREIASPGPLGDFKILGMYPHRPTGEYRLLLQGRRYERSYWGPPTDRTGFYVLALGSHQLPRYVDVGCSETKLASAAFGASVRLRDCLHWHTVYYRKGGDDNSTKYYEAQSELVIVFDTIAESFREMGAPLVRTKSYVFEMDDMLGIYTCNNNKITAQVVDIWVLHNYESEVWDLKYRVELPIAGIRGMPEGIDGHGYWYLTVASGDGDVLLLVCFDHSLFYVDTDGKLVATFQNFYPSIHRLKQTLVPHDFFTALEGYAVNSLPFIPSV